MESKLTIKKILLFRIPMSICNFRCHYCYLAQRPIHYQGIQPKMQVSPESFGNALTISRLGGVAYGNFCADGETLLTKDIDLYVKAFVEQGHFAEVVTNLTIDKVLDKILSWDKNLLSHLEFKCSFHYLELKKKGLLEQFTANVHRIWEAGASANIEITPSDELIPYIEEVKAFSVKHFGALPHLTIARNDRTKGIEYLTNLTMSDYDKVWSQFGSDFWKFKKTIFGKKQRSFCYAGAWSLYIDMATGRYRSCYFGTDSEESIYDNITKPLPSVPVGQCQIAHCYNGHALLALGLIPSLSTPLYGDIRDRDMIDGRHWLQPELKRFFNTKLIESNQKLKLLPQIYYYNRLFMIKARNYIKYRILNNK